MMFVVQSKGAATQGVPRARTRLAASISLRISAVSATLGGLPAARRRWVKARRLDSTHHLPRSVDFSSVPSAVQAPLVERERRVWNSAVHDSEFATVAHPAARSVCGATQPPQALATPDPLLEVADLSARVSVSFVIGTDGGCIAR